jgi:hypothetical protein
MFMIVGVNNQSEKKIIIKKMKGQLNKTLLICI